MKIKTIDDFIATLDAMHLESQEQLGKERNFSDPVYQEGRSYAYARAVAAAKELKANMAETASKDRALLLSLTYPQYSLEKINNGRCAST
jgi:hypothetical protein